MTLTDEQLKEYEERFSKFMADFTATEADGIKKRSEFETKILNALEQFRGEPDFLAFCIARSITAHLTAMSMLIRKVPGVKEAMIAETIERTMGEGMPPAPDTGAGFGGGTPPIGNA